ncbi:MAG: alpha-2-macroglobulin family protein [Rhodobacterales bacterium]|nr:alpha-2-macroglobulin family protein [Rhodobacterales bacterium]NCT13499.1 alpha-2-macroglobulin family protein [Rhodobacterales bacterium]
MRAFLMSLLLLVTAPLAQAQDIMPDRRVAISRNVDYPGGDLRSIFDTTLDACQAACLADPQCRAFTFNQRSNACFPKGAISQITPFDGAISARILPTDPAVMAQAGARRAELTFLSEGDIAAARELAGRIGRFHSSDDFSADELLEAAGFARQRGETMGAFRFTGAAVAVADRADLWLAYALLGRDATGPVRGDVNTARARVLPALVNAYLRAMDATTRATVLYDMAFALETAGRGRDMIPALRLAQDIQPRRDAEAALERAVGLYGFGVAETQVDSDSAVPRLCVIFNARLVQAGVDYAPYVQLPEVNFSVDVSDRQLCIDGVVHGERYRLVLRQGLPAESGETLARPVELTLYVRDRTPAVRFLSRAYVLPRLGDAALPVETVNLDTLELHLSRVSDRNILRTLQEGQFASPLYPWEQEYFDDLIGQEVWRGTATVARDLNRDVITRLPLDAALSGQAAGVYVLNAAIPGADPYDNPAATQWFILSDLGIATMLGTDGLTVMVRGLGDAQAVAGAEVTLLSRANAVLGTAQSDADGVARFEAGLTRGVGSAAPALVTVTDAGGDMAFLSLSDPAFDLSDRGVEGREPAPPIDVFLTTDRGAYRAGEVIHLTALMRDAQAHALAGVPLTAVLTRPDGVEYSRIASGADVAGGHVFALPVAGSAPHGTWGIAVYADVDAPALARQSVLVEDFLPERIDFDLTLPALLRLGDVPDLAIAARYLFGPPAADLAIEGEAMLRAANGLPDWPGYVFGRHEEAFDTRYRSFEDGFRTDADGAALIPVTFPDLDAEVSQPLSLTTVLRIAEGSGRPVERRTEALVLPDLPMIGIKPAAEEVVPEYSLARFSLIALAPDLSPQPMTVRWTVNKVETTYQWYQIYGNWNWEPTTRRSRVASGEVTLGDAPVEVAADVEWGAYEIVVERVGPGYVAASAPFYAGWYVSAEAEATPDVLDLSLDAARYAVGDTATLRIVPRYAGTAVITVMSNRVIAMQAVEVTEGETTIPLPVTAEWGAGAYVTATVIRPMDTGANRNPARALGLAHAAVAPGDKALTVTLDTPAVAAPRETMTVGVQVDGVAAGETAHVTLAAVDVGILNLTAFASPDPQGHYFGQRKLGVEMRDVYGRLIDGMNGALGTVRSGGDAMAQMSLQSPPPTEELVAYFEGPVTVGADGRAEVSFALPAFNGTVRLMAVAWSDRGVGQASTDVVVRDPVVVTASLPRFLAPGDQSRLLLELVHADGPAGEMALAVTADGVALASQLIPAAVTLAPGGRQVLRLPFTAQDTGLHSITVTLTTPDGRVLTKVLNLPVMSNDPEVARTSRFMLAAGETFTFDDNVFAGLLPGSGKATLSVGALGRFDAPGLLAALDRYPYGCTEQVTSRALPLIYFDEVAVAMGLATGDAISTRIAQAVQEVLGNQDANGAFGLWRPDSGDLWLDAYVTDFLSRARARGHAVPDLAFRNAIDNLRNRVNYAPDFESGGEDIAYALMVLAREGQAAVGDLRYYADERAFAFSTPLASAQLGAALAFYGDQMRADTMFRQASDQMTRAAVDLRLSLWRSDYGTNRRDAAAVLALAVEAGSLAVDRDMLAARIGGATGRPSTQEAAWTLMAANALIDDLRQTGISIDNAPPTGPLVQVRDAQVAAAPIAIRNKGDAATEITLTSFGVPAEPEPAGGNGYAITRAWFTMEGVPVTLDSVAVGTRLVAVVTVQPFGRQEARLMVSDPLPAGFEIDNPNLIAGGDIRALDWLDPVAAAHAEFRQDRFLAAVDWQGDRPFQLAYVVRAVSPGSFHLPAASVEDMYRPLMRARSDTGRVSVTE